MFEQDGRADAPARALSRHEDGRRTRTNLAVTADDVAKAIVALKAAFLG